MFSGGASPSIAVTEDMHCAYMVLFVNLLDGVHMKTVRLIIFTFLIIPALLIAQADQGPLDWEENAEFGVEIAGKIDITAQVFRPTNYQPYLILTSGILKTPVLIDLGKKQVLRLKSGDINNTDGDFLKTSGIPRGKSIGSYTLKGGASTFRIDGREVALTMRQTLVGKVQPSLILAHSPDYRIRKDAYKPDATSMRFLKNYGKTTEVIVIFATWCSNCKLVIPPVLRVFDEANNSHLKVTYYGIAQGGGEPREVIERYGHDYPAVILIQNGKEIDRIVGEPPVPIEKRIVNILR